MDLVDFSELNPDPKALQSTYFHSDMATFTPLSAQAEEKFERWNEELERLKVAFVHLGLQALILTASDPAWFRIQDLSGKMMFQLRLSSGCDGYPSLHIRRTAEAFQDDDPDDNFVRLDLEVLLRKTGLEVLSIFHAASTTR